MRRPLWLFGVVILALVLTTVGIGFAVRDDDGTTGAEVQITPRAAGLSMPTSTSAVLPTPEPSPTPTPRVHTPGQEVVVSSESGEPVVMYADANRESPLLEIYREGASFTVLAPSGEYVEYPVVRGETAWYRVRDVDGLVGWVNARHIRETE
jgi:hypothetical protein